MTVELQPTLQQGLRLVELLCCYYWRCVYYCSILTLSGPYHWSFPFGCLIA